MELHGPSPLCLCPALRKALLRVRGLAIVTLCHLRGVCGERSPFSSWGVEGLVGEKGDSGTFSGHGPLIPTAGDPGCWGQAWPFPQASGGTGAWGHRRVALSRGPSGSCRGSGPSAAHCTAALSMDLPAPPDYGNRL